MSGHYSSFISATLQGAAKIAIARFGRVGSTTKVGDANQVLTQADLEIGAFIIAQIQAHFPSHNIIDEEAGVLDKNSALTWVVDPIDGTSNFAAALPTYGIMMGLLDGASAIAGGIVLPAFDELYSAEQGQGATCNGRSIQVSTATSLVSTLVAYGIDGHQEAPEKTAAEVRLLGKIIVQIRNLRTTNSAYDMAHTADGKYGAYLNQTTKIWDNVALQPIIEEAGGVVTDFWGKPMDYSLPLTKADQNFTICAGSQQMHQQLQKIIFSS